MEKLQEALQAISTAQQQLGANNEMAKAVGDQLKDILRETPAGAELVLADITQPGMGLKDCERKISEYARAHRAGNCGVCTPAAADKIIREFYGIPAKGQTTTPAAKPEAQTSRKAISLADFL